ncbi:capsular polysaccharide synthesis protein [Acinetobacter bereziniae]|uniref:capsular polysaccharide synthesis protein n=1 Tax=Acinetobacter bereziniae TaxID=106648 RepID=UPI002953D0E0|nr:capsular polysaccharide synthesis protein [Acinetobacter bereziniae]MDV8156080.1 capsular polysaccharide synthesis protein [Acinetobacter bereziniae]
MGDISNIFNSETNFKSNIDRLSKFPFRIFYFTFVPKSFRKKLNRKANILQKKHVELCWDIFLDYYFSNQLEKYQLKEKKQFNDQKIIWQYWGQGIQSDLPHIVKLCFSSVDQFKADYQVIRLDESNIKDYLDLPDFVWDKRNNSKFKHAFFADLIRLALLNVYGGVWLDATILLTAPIKSEILDADYFMFQRHRDTPEKQLWYDRNHDYFDWSDEQNVNVLNSFIVGKKGNEVLQICLDVLLNFWRTQENIPHYFFFQIMYDVLIKDRFKSQQCEIIDDTLPHLLQFKLNEQFSSVEYNQILQQINIHKMNYIDKVVENSYYNFLTKQFLSNENS